MKKRSILLASTFAIASAASLTSCGVNTGDAKLPTIEVLNQFAEYDESVVAKTQTVSIVDADEFDNGLFYKESDDAITYKTVYSTKTVTVEKSKYADDGFRYGMYVISTKNGSKYSVGIYDYALNLITTYSALTEYPHFEEVASFTYKKNNKSVTERKYYVSGLEDTSGDYIYTTEIEDGDYDTVSKTPSAEFTALSNNRNPVVSVDSALGNVGIFMETKDNLDKTTTYKFTGNSTEKEVVLDGEICAIGGVFNDTLFLQTTDTAYIDKGNVTYNSYDKNTSLKTYKIDLKTFEAKEISTSVAFIDGYVSATAENAEYFCSKYYKINNGAVDLNEELYGYFDKDGDLCYSTPFDVNGFYYKEAFGGIMAYDNDGAYLLNDDLIFQNHYSVVSNVYMGSQNGTYIAYDANGEVIQKLTFGEDIGAEYGYYSADGKTFYEAINGAFTARKIITWGDVEKENKVAYVTGAFYVTCDNYDSTKINEFNARLIGTNNTFKLYCKNGYTPTIYREISYEKYGAVYGVQYSYKTNTCDTDDKVNYLMVK